MNLLSDNKSEFGYRIFHYCIMQTHFHLAVCMVSRDEFSAAMKQLKQQYALWFHERWKRSGPVWWGRFKGQLIEDEKYLFACGRYIEQNPVKAGLTQKPWEWSYSSSAHYEQGVKDGLIDAYELPESKEIDLTEDRLFERGLAVGTRLFRFQQRERMEGR